MPSVIRVSPEVNQAREAFFRAIFGEAMRNSARNQAAQQQQMQGYQQEVEISFK